MHNRCLFLSNSTLSATMQRLFRRAAINAKRATTYTTIETHEPAGSTSRVIITTSPVKKSIITCMYIGYTYNIGRRNKIHFKIKMTNRCCEIFKQYLTLQKVTPEDIEYIMSGRIYKNDIAAIMGVAIDLFGGDCKMKFTYDLNGKNKYYVVTNQICLYDYTTGDVY